MDWNSSILNHKYCGSLYVYIQPFLIQTIWNPAKYVYWENKRVNLRSPPCKDFIKVVYWLNQNSTPEFPNWAYGLIGCLFLGDWWQKPPPCRQNLVGVKKMAAQQNQITLGKENCIPLQGMVSCLPHYIIPWFIWDYCPISWWNSKTLSLNVCGCCQETGALRLFALRGIE